MEDWKLHYCVVLTGEMLNLINIHNIVRSC